MTVIAVVMGSEGEIDKWSGAGLLWGKVMHRCLSLVPQPGALPGFDRVIRGDEETQDAIHLPGSSRISRGESSKKNMIYRSHILAGLQGV